MGLGRRLQEIAFGAMILIPSVILLSCTKNAGKTVTPTGPTLSTLLPATSAVNPIPTSIVAAFSEAMTGLSTSDFAIGGTCTTLPTKDSVAMSVNNTVATLSISGGSCTDGQILTVTVDPTLLSSASGTAGSGAAQVNTYTVDTSGPSAALGTPSASSLNASGSTTIALTYTASAAGGTTLTGTLTAGGGGVTVTTVSGNPSCTLNVSSISTSGATLTLSGCSGNGTLKVRVDAGTAEDTLGNMSTVSNDTATITVDNSAPTLTSLTPATSFVNPTPTSIVATFSEAMTALTASAFTLGGTCTVLPTKGSVVMSSGNTVTTLSLTGGTCTDAQTLTVALDPTTVADSAGNSGTGSTVTNTYTVDTSGPSASLSAPSSTSLNSSSSSTIDLTYTASAAGGTALTGTLTAGGGGVTVTSVSGNPSCSIGVSSITTSGATLTLSSCSGNGTLKVHVNAGTAKDSLNNLSTVSNDSSLITVDNTAPTFGSSSPAGGSTFASVPSSLTVFFSEAITTTEAAFTMASGTCDTNPTVSSISGSGTDTITVNLSGGSCTGSETVVLSITMTSVSDDAGNTGSGTQTVTLTYQAPPTLTSFTTSSGVPTAVGSALAPVWAAGTPIFVKASAASSSPGCASAATNSSGNLDFYFGSSGQTNTGWAPGNDGSGQGSGFDNLCVKLCDKFGPTVCTNWIYVTGN